MYEPSTTPCLYVAPAENMVGRVPLIPLFLAGNSTPTIPHMFSQRKEAGFPFGCADAAALDGRRGSNIYEVNPWLWQFGRGKPRLGGLSIEQTVERKDAASDARHKRAAETRRARKTGSQDGSSLIPSKGWYISVCTNLYVVYRRIYSYVPSLHTCFQARVFFSLLAAGCAVQCMEDLC